jgi:hypothetical protein
MSEGGGRERDVAKRNKRGRFRALWLQVAALPDKELTGLDITPPLHLPRRVREGREE